MKTYLGKINVNILWESNFIYLSMKHHKKPNHRTRNGKNAAIYRRDLAGWIRVGKGAFNNYVDRILPLFDPLSPCVDSFYTLSVDKNRHFLTPFPPHLVHIVIECPHTADQGNLLRGIVFVMSFDKHSF